MFFRGGAISSNHLIGDVKQNGAKALMDNARWQSVSGDWIVLEQMNENPKYYSALMMIMLFNGKCFAEGLDSREGTKIRSATLIVGVTSALPAPQTRELKS